MATTDLFDYEKQNRTRTAMSFMNSLTCSWKVSALPCQPYIPTNTWQYGQCVCWWRWSRLRYRNAEMRTGHWIVVDTPSTSLTLIDLVSNSISAWQWWRTLSETMVKHFAGCISQDSQINIQHLHFPEILSLRCGAFAWLLESSIAHLLINTPA